MLNVSKLDQASKVNNIVNIMLHFNNCNLIIIWNACSCIFHIIIVGEKGYELNCGVFDVTDLLDGSDNNAINSGRIVAQYVEKWKRKSKR